MTSTLTAVLVLYRQSLAESRCYQSLLQARSLASCGMVLLLFDNSPESQLPTADAVVAGERFAGTLLYQHDPANGGVAAAYNAGLQEARQNGSQWLLLLDQDTEITPAYLSELQDCMHRVPREVSAIIPRLVQGGATHSPQQLPHLSHRPVSDAVAGMLQTEVTAYNSGAALRVAAVNSFPMHYWLDFLDHAVFHELQAAGGRIWLMHARLSHRLSTERLGTEASLGRYLNVLQAERDFYQQFGSPAQRRWYHLRRVKQSLGQLLKVRDKHFALLSLKAALGLLPPTPPR